jgi:DNA-directed RNA polymerase
MFNEIQAISSGENSVKGVEHIAKLGLSIITVLSKAEILDPVKSAGNTEKKLNPLSQENPKVLLCFKQQTLKKSAGYATLKKVRVTESAMQDLASVDFAPLSELAPVPMLTIPKVWNSTKNGGYFDIKTSFLRVKESRYQTEVLNNANLTKMYQAANALGKTPWKVNRDIYELMMTCWDRKIKIGKIPSRMDFDVPEVDPELFKNMSKAEKRTVRQQNQTISQKNAELHSLRCDFLLRVNVAKDLLDDVIYFPYNFDFRGRAYPIPPHLNHMGSDIARSLLTVRFNLNLLYSNPESFGIVCKINACDRTRNILDESPSGKSFRKRQNLV